MNTSMSDLTRRVHSGDVSRIGNGRRKGAGRNGNAEETTTSRASCQKSSRLLRWKVTCPTSPAGSHVAFDSKRFTKYHKAPAVIAIAVSLNEDGQEQEATECSICKKPSPTVKAWFFGCTHCQSLNLCRDELSTQQGRIGPPGRE